MLRPVTPVAPRTRACFRSVMVQFSGSGRAGAAGGRRSRAAPGRAATEIKPIVPSRPSRTRTDPAESRLAAGPVVELGRRHTALVVLEEHSVYGGLGSAVAEIAAAHAPTWVCRIGVPDRFSECCGSYAYLMREHRLDVHGVTEQVEQFLAARAMPRAA